MTTNKLERIIKYNFNNVNLLKEALIHSSYSSRSCKNNKKNYERLEFLGDRVLGLVLAEYVFHVFPEANEGLLNSYYQKYVSQEYLFNYSKKIQLSNFIKTQKGDKLDDNKSILSDVVESIIGAIYLDGGIEPCRNLILDTIWAHKHEAWKSTNYKGKLIEYCHIKDIGSPSFNIKDITGPDHQKTFEIEVKIDDRSFPTGMGLDKKSAEQTAAKIALEQLNAPF